MKFSYEILRDDGPAICSPPARPLTSFAAATASRNRFRKNIAVVSRLWPQDLPTQSQHGMTASTSMPARSNSHGNDLTFAQLYAVAFHGAKVSLAPDAAERMKASRAMVDRAGRSRQDRLRHQHRLRQTRLRPHLHRTSPPAAGKSRSLARLRCRRAAQRSRNARDDASPRQRARQRTERHPPRNRRRRSAKC